MLILEKLNTVKGCEDFQKIIRRIKKIPLHLRSKFCLLFF